MSDFNGRLVQIQTEVAEGHLMKAAGLCRELADAIDQVALERYGLNSPELNETPLEDQWTVAAPPPREVAPAFPGPNASCLMGIHEYNGSDNLGRWYCVHCGHVSLFGPNQNLGA